jgi:flagellar motor switch protein FliM
MAVSPSGETAAEAEQGSEEAPAVRPLDFSQPSKFSPELRRRIGAAVESSCETLSASMSASLKAEVLVEPADSAQNTWAAARAGLAADGIAVAVHADQPARSMLLHVEQPMILQSLECLLGGKAAQAPSERRLSEIDWTLAKGLLDTVVAELDVAWRDLGGPQLTRGELDLEGDAGVTVAPGEPTLSLQLRTHIDGCESAIWVLMPWSAVQSVADGQHGGGGETAAAEPAAAGLREGLSVAQVLLRAEVGSVQMPIGEMLDIAPGSVVELSERSEDGVRLYAEEVSVGRGRPGRSAARKAIKLEAADEQPVHAATYAKLGRAELDRARAHARSAAEDDASPSILHSIFVRVWAELGRTHIALGRALELAPGTVVELDQGAERPIELFANGLCFASGSLVVTAEGGWGVAVEQLM